MNDALRATVEVRDVWGIGRKLTEALMHGGTMTTDQLRRMDARRIRDRFNAVVRTVNELQGVLCVAWETEPLAKQQTIAPRSFGGPLYTPEALAEPVHLHAGRTAEKLR